MNQKRERLILGSVLAVWLLLVLFCVISHEMWRDELQAILIVKESSSLAEVFFNSRYEGHGPLWFIFLYAVSGISESIMTYQISHVVISTFTAYLILFHSPFRLTTRILLVFGYYYIFEYSVLTRNYAFAALLLVLTAFSYNREVRNFFVIRVIAVSLLATTSIYGMIVGFCFYLFISLKEKSKQHKLILAAVFIPVLLVSAWKMYPPEDSGFATEWFTGLDLQKAVHSFEIIYESVIPLPETQLHFWGTNVLDGSPFLTGIKVLLSLGVLFIARHLLGSRSLWILFSAVTIAIVVFTYVKYEGYIRHYGHIFLVLIACLWIHESAHEHKDKRKIVLLNFILALHVVSGSIALYYDYTKPFSGAKEAANYLKLNAGNSDLISADTDFIGTPVSGYLNRKIYFPQSERTGTYIILDAARGPLIGFDTVFARTTRKASEGQQIYFLLDYPVDTLNDQLKLVYEGPEAVVEDEQYLIYRYRKP